MAETQVVVRFQRCIGVLKTLHELPGRLQLLNSGCIASQSHEGLSRQNRKLQGQQTVESPIGLARKPRPNDCQGL